MDKTTDVYHSVNELHGLYDRIRSNGEKSLFEIEKVREKIGDADRVMFSMDKRIASIETTLKKIYDAATVRRSMADDEDVSRRMVNGKIGGTY